MPCWEFPYHLRALTKWGVACLVALLQNTPTTCTIPATTTTTTATQGHEAKATSLGSKKRPTIPLKGGGLLLLEPGVVSFSVCLYEHLANNLRVYA